MSEEKKYLQSKVNTCLYLERCFEEDPRLFLVGLRKVAAARGGLSELSRKTGLNRQHLYTMLSPQGNPEATTLVRILEALELKVNIQVRPKRPS